MALLLKKFSVSNFRGFKDCLVWDLGQVLPYENHTEVVQGGVVRKGIVYGPNGSGKSNFSLAVFDIVHHLSQKMKDRDFYANYAYAGARDEYVRFRYEFVSERGTLSYAYAKRADGWLMEEELEVGGQCLISRKQNGMTLVGMELELADSVIEQFRTGVNNVSIVGYLLSKVSLPEGHYLVMLQHFVDSMLWFHGREAWKFIGLDSSATNMNQFINQNGHIQGFEGFLRELSGQDFQLVGDPNNETVFYARINGTLVPFDSIASTGTKELKLLYYWMTRMKDASFVFIDEFDAFYHFALSKNICKRLMEQSLQLFLTTHNTALMTNDLLRPDCYFVIGNGVIKPIFEATKKDLMGDYNLERLYRGGTFAV